LIRQVAYQLAVTPGGASPVGHRPPHERELSNPGFNGKKRSKMSAIAIEATAHRYGRVGALSTATAIPALTRRRTRRHPFYLAKMPRSDARKFMILTEFSRCQGSAIGRVSGRPNTPLQHKDFP
jgi:hypothetical protein